MPLKSVVEDIESVPEALRGEYTEQDGKFYLNVEDIDNHPGVAGLKSALQKERGSRGAFEKQIKAWQGLGKSPDEIAELLAAREQEEAEKAKKAGDFDKILAQHKTAWEKEKAAIEAELNAARSSERSAVVGERLLGALAKAGVTEEGSELLPEQLSKRIKFETVDGRRVLKIMQVDGETPMAGKGVDGSATIDDLVEETKMKFQSLFKGTGAGGSGKPPSQGSGGSGVTKKSDLKTMKAKGDYVEKYGMEAYEALPA